MAKRKAEGSQRGGKAPARPPPPRQPPPPPQEDDSDSDVCEIVSPPPNSNPPRQKPRKPSVGFSPASGSHPQAHPSAGFLSMMSGTGMPAFGLAAAGQAAHFGYHQPIQAPNGFNPYLFAAPQLFPPQAGIQGGFFPAAPMPLPAGASSGGGASSGASEVAPPHARVREGSGAQEVKEEPEDTLQPRPDEVEMVRTLRRYGVTTPDAVHSLRECGHQVEEALQLALDTAKTRAENKAMDKARLESEKEKDLAAERRSLEEKALKVLGEVTSHFPKSLLLNAEDGCRSFRQFVERLSAGDGTCTQALCAFREKATTLLFLERDAFRHYPESDRQIRGYFRQVSQRLQDRVAAGRETDETEGVSGEERRTNHLTASVGEEVEALQQILYHFPKTPGGVPDAFLDTRGGENVATLEKDGVEEDHDRKRSARSKDPVVVTVED